MEGPHPPSSEFPFHKAIYDVRPDIQAIVHAHPVALVAFSICGQTPDTRLFHQAHYVCGTPGFAPYALPGSQQLGRNIADVFQNGSNCVILENHGVVVGADSLSVAFQRFEALEFAAKTVVKASHLGEVKYLSPQQLEQARRRGTELRSFTHDDASTTEKELRRELYEFIGRGYRQRLLISTEGSFSARVDEQSFLITPSRVDRGMLDIGDFVLIRNGQCQQGTHPSRATLAHQAIYQRHPAIQAIVFAHPVNTTAFSVTATQLDARTIPESYLFLRDVALVPYGLHYDEEGDIAQYVSLDAPAAILENDGVLVAGSSVLDAFDRLEVLESTAEAIINARSLGPIAAMPEQTIDELRKAFLS